ncbi:MFS transporter [Pelagerythrobacter rhizovicinus]|uniref:MFS transporter n=1 Tax=Pelagerythrobacter rhizovicinus TaxID=2268576 RepID=A0A4Q2KMN4_9SPHN|nr:MFS transporter [Pelagerythrobacter rhizovicinus]RXZ65717.1 MFS transporter [Pelagerythrobacter rhizovicinus]
MDTAPPAASSLSAGDRPEAAPPALQSTRFLYLYALAAAGGAVAYVPFLTMLLPVRVSSLAGEEAVSVLAYTAFAGATAASLANIAFGWLSDLTGDRRPWIVAGLVLSCLLLVSVRTAASVPVLIAFIVAWQVCLNMMLAPLAAWAGDLVPDRQKGLLGGLLSFAPALGALSGALVTLPAVASADARLGLVAAMVVAMVLPALVFGAPRPMPQLMIPRKPEKAVDTGGRAARTAVARMWLARLLVQIAEAMLFAYLLLWFRSIEPGYSDNDTATLFFVVLGLGVPLALLTGRWSDRADRPIAPLAAGAGIAAIGLLLMALAPSLTLAITGYVAFGLASTVFLALHSGQTLRVLTRPQTRGRDLGLFNLTNTVPSLIMPWFALALVPTFGFAALFLLLAGLAALACILLLSISRRA